MQTRLDLRACDTPPTPRRRMYTCLVRDEQVHARHLYQGNGNLNLIVNLEHRNLSLIRSTNFLIVRLDYTYSL